MDTSDGLEFELTYRAYRARIEETKGFKIPKKADVNVNVHAPSGNSFNHPSTSTEGPNVGSEGVEFVDFSVEDPSFKRDVIEPFQKTILQPILKNLCIFKHGKRIYNRILSDRFFARKNKLKSYFGSTLGPDEFAYMLLESEQSEEEDFICRHGVYCGYSGVTGELGAFYHGVYLSLHPDACTPTEIYQGQNMRILMFKVLKGRPKFISITSDPAENLRPARGCTSHVYKMSDLDSTSLEQSTAFTRFKHSQIFLYEYDDEGKPVEVPSSILPYAILTVQFNIKNKNKFSVPPTFQFKPMPQYDQLIWSGPLYLEDIIIESVDMVVPSQDATKPFGFSSSLTIDKLLRVTDWVAFPPITQLLQHPGILLQHPKSYHLQLHSEINDNNQHFTVSYKIIVSNFGSPNNISPSFRRVHNNIRKGQLVGLSVLPNGTILFFVPNSELSSLFGLPRHDRPAFHCIFISEVDPSPSSLPNDHNEYTIDESLKPPAVEQINFVENDVRRRIEDYYKNTAFAGARVAPSLKTLNSPQFPPVQEHRYGILPPRPPHFLPPFFPQMFNGMMVPPVPMQMPQMFGGWPVQNIPLPPLPFPSTNLPSNSVASLLVPPPPPPPSHKHKPVPGLRGNGSPTPEEIRRKKFRYAMEGRQTSTPDGMSKSGGTSSSKMNVSPSNSLTPEIRQLLSSVTDPRLKKRLLSDPKSLEEYAIKKRLEEETQAHSQLQQNSNKSSSTITIGPEILVKIDDARKDAEMQRPYSPTKPNDSSGSSSCTNSDNEMISEPEPMIPEVEVQKEVKLQQKRPVKMVEPLMKTATYIPAPREVTSPTNIEVSVDNGIGDEKTDEIDHHEMITISKGNQNKLVSPGSEKGGKTKEESFSSTALGSTIERKSIANDDTFEPIITSTPLARSSSQTLLESTKSHNPCTFSASTPANPSTGFNFNFLSWSSDSKISTDSKGSETTMREEGFLESTLKLALKKNTDDRDIEADDEENLANNSSIEFLCTKNAEKQMEEGECSDENVGEDDNRSDRSNLTLHSTSSSFWKTPPKEQRQRSRLFDFDGFCDSPLSPSPAPPDPPAGTEERNGDKDGTDSSESQTFASDDEELNKTLKDALDDPEDDLDTVNPITLRLPAFARSDSSPKEERNNGVSAPIRRINDVFSRPLCFSPDSKYLDRCGYEVLQQPWSSEGSDAVAQSSTSDTYASVPPWLHATSPLSITTAVKTIPYRLYRLDLSPPQSVKINLINSDDGTSRCSSDSELHNSHGEERVLDPRLHHIFSEQNSSHSSSSTISVPSTAMMDLNLNTEQTATNDGENHAKTATRNEAIDNSANPIDSTIAPIKETETEKSVDL